jgi:hypothetical protein
MNATVVAAEIAAGAALVAAATSAVTAVVTNRWQSQSDSSLKRLEQQFSDRQRATEYMRRQLNDFYGRVYMLRRQSESLRRLLPDKDQKGDRWRLVDHIIDVKNSANAKHKQAVEMILEFDKEIAGLLTTSVGLYDQFPAPQSYTDFVQHYELLQLAWDQNQSQSPAERLPFPDQFDVDLNAAIEDIKKRLDKLVTALYNVEKAVNRSPRWYSLNSGRMGRQAAPDRLGSRRHDPRGRPLRATDLRHHARADDHRNRPGRGLRRNRPWLRPRRLLTHYPSPPGCGTPALAWPAW